MLAGFVVISSSALLGAYLRNGQWPTDVYQREIRQQTRLVNQLTATLKTYYPRALEVAESTTALARDFLRAYPTPWRLWRPSPNARGSDGRAPHRLSEQGTEELWAILQRPQLPVPAHVVRAKARLMQALVTELEPVVSVVEAYRQAVEDFFAAMPAAQWIGTLPFGEHGVTAPTL